MHKKNMYKYKRYKRFDTCVASATAVETRTGCCRWSARKRSLGVGDRGRVCRDGPKKSAARVRIVRDFCFFFFFLCTAASSCAENVIIYTYIYINTHLGNDDFDFPLRTSPRSG